MAKQTKRWRYFMGLLIILAPFLLGGCDLDLEIQHALLLDDPVVFVGEKQIHLEMKGPAWDIAREAAVDLDALLAQTLRENLPADCLGTWEITKEKLLVDLALPFHGLEDYATKLHGSAPANSYIDLPGSGQDELEQENLYTSKPADLPHDLQQEEERGQELFARKDQSIEGQRKGLATSYFEPSRQLIRDDEDLLFYLSLGQKSHLTDAQLTYAEALVDPVPTMVALLEDLTPLFPPPKEDAKPGPRLKYGGDLLIIGNQVYATDRDSEDAEYAVLHQERSLPLEMKIRTSSYDGLSFDREIHYVLPFADATRSYERLIEQLNFDLPEPLRYTLDLDEAEGMAISTRLEGLTFKELGETTRTLLGDGYQLNREENDAGSSFGVSELWTERFAMPHFFSAAETADDVCASLELSGLYDAVLNDDASEVSEVLNFKRRWSAIALQTFWDGEFIRRYHFFVESDVDVLTDYLIDMSLDPESKLYSLEQEPYQHLVLEQRTEDLAAIEEQTKRLFGETELEAEWLRSWRGEALQIVEHYNFSKLADDQAIYLFEGEAPFPRIEGALELLRTGGFNLILPQKSYQNFYLAGLLIIFVVVSSLHPRGPLRHVVLRLVKRLRQYRAQKRQAILARPLHWGDRFVDSQGREIRLDAALRPDNETHKILKWR